MGDTFDNPLLAQENLRMWPFDFLVSTIQTSFSQASSDYNQVHQLVKKLEQQNQQLRQQSLVLTSMNRMLTNRYNGIRQINKLPEKAREGAYWVYYWGFAPALQEDVKESAKTWAYSKLSLDMSLEDLKKAGATALGTSTQDIQQIQALGRERAKIEGQFLAGSVAASTAVSMVLKKASNTVQHQYGKMFLRGTLRTWQVTSVLAFMYGLGRVCEAMHESGAFAVSLRERRDRFIITKKQELDQQLKSMSSYMKEIEPSFTD